MFNDLIKHSTTKLKQQELQYPRFSFEFHQSKV